MTSPTWYVLRLAAREPDGPWCFEQGEVAWLGSDPGADVVVAHPSVRARHARISWFEGVGYVLEEFEGQTRGGRERVVERAVLGGAVGDEATVWLGEVELEFEVISAWEAIALEDPGPGEGDGVSDTWAPPPRLEGDEVWDAGERAWREGGWEEAGGQEAGDARVVFLMERAASYAQHVLVFVPPVALFGVDVWLSGACAAGYPPADAASAMLLALLVTLPACRALSTWLGGPGLRARSWALAFMTLLMLAPPDADALWVIVGLGAAAVASSWGWMIALWVTSPGYPGAFARPRGWLPARVDNSRAGPGHEVILEGCHVRRDGGARVTAGASLADGEFVALELRSAAPPGAYVHVERAQRVREATSWQGRVGPALAAPGAAWALARLLRAIGGPSSGAVVHDGDGLLRVGSGRADDLGAVYHAARRLLARLEGRRAWRPPHVSVQEGALWLAWVAAIGWVYARRLEAMAAMYTP